MPTTSITDLAKVLADFAFASTDIGGVFRAEGEREGVVVHLTIRPLDDRWSYYLSRPRWSSFGTFRTIDELRTLLEMFAPLGASNREVPCA